MTQIGCDFSVWAWQGKKFERGPESYGNEKYYYFWVHKQYVKHTPSRGSGGMPPQEKSAIRLNLEAILTSNLMLLSKGSMVHVIKALNMRIFLYS